MVEAEQEVKCLSDWSLEEALPLIKQIEEICPNYGYHVALTGGTLYKEGRRKDLDLLFYAIRQEPARDFGPLLDELKNLGFSEVQNSFGWVVKARYKGRGVDLFFPEMYPAGEGTDYGVI